MIIKNCFKKTVTDREVWLGNENIHLLTNSEDYELRVELADFEGNIRYLFYHFIFQFTQSINKLVTF